MQGMPSVEGPRQAHTSWPHIATTIIERVCAVLVVGRAVLNAACRGQRFLSRRRPTAGKGFGRVRDTLKEFTGLLECLQSDKDLAASLETLMTEESRNALVGLGYVAEYAVSMLACVLC